MFICLVGCFVWSDVWSCRVILSVLLWWSVFGVGLLGVFNGFVGSVLWLIVIGCLLGLGFRWFCYHIGYI